MLTELTIKEFIHKVISNDPVPGGGSVSAFNGALATSLAAMVANLTIGRKKYAEVNEVMEDLSARFEELARQLIIDVDRDSDAYNRVFAAFKLPKETEEEKNKNGILIALAIVGAIATVAAIAYAVYRYFTPDYLDDFDDDYEDDFDDDYIEFSDSKPEAEN